MIAIVQGTQETLDYEYVLKKLNHLFSKQNHVSVATAPKHGACKLAALYATLTDNCDVNIFPAEAEPDDVVEQALQSGQPVGLVLFGNDKDTLRYAESAEKHNVKTVQLPAGTA